MSKGLIVAAGLVTSFITANDPAAAPISIYMGMGNDDPAPEAQTYSEGVFGAAGNNKGKLSIIFAVPKTEGAEGATIDKGFVFKKSPNAEITSECYDLAADEGDVVKFGPNRNYHRFTLENVSEADKEAIADSQCVTMRPRSLGL